MSRGIDTRKDLDVTVVGPAFTLPVALVVSGIDFDLDDPLYVLDTVKSRYEESDRETMFLRQLLAVHQEGEHHIVLHGPLKRNAVVVPIDAAEHNIASSFFIGAAFLKKFLERNAAPGGVTHAVSARERIDAHECRDLIVRIAIQDIAPAE